MIKPNFYLKTDKLKDNLSYPTYLKMTHKGKSTTLSTENGLQKKDGIQQID
ncbi:hypothetical protein [Flavisericum labens]|uniref:hypothetical protein n=1 Tax=Flavisericum labens TaxID=3377112 RepID=UPI00387B005F